MKRDEILAGLQKTINGFGYKVSKISYIRETPAYQPGFEVKFEFKKGPKSLEDLVKKFKTGKNSELSVNKEVIGNITTIQKNSNEIELDKDNKLGSVYILYVDIPKEIRLEENLKLYIKRLLSIESIKPAKKKITEAPKDDKSDDANGTGDDTEDIGTDDKQDTSPKEEKPEPEDWKDQTPKPCMIKFNTGLVKKYNKVPFIGNSGYVSKVDKEGVYVVVDNNKTIFVNISDIITESVKRINEDSTVSSNNKFKDLSKVNQAKVIKVLNNIAYNCLAGSTLVRINIGTAPILVGIPNQSLLYADYQFNGYLDRTDLANLNKTDGFIGLKFINNGILRLFFDKDLFLGSIIK